MKYEMKEMCININTYLSNLEERVGKTKNVTIFDSECYNCNCM